MRVATLQDSDRALPRGSQPGQTGAYALRASNQTNVKSDILGICAVLVLHFADARLSTKTGKRRVRGRVSSVRSSAVAAAVTARATKGPVYRSLDDHLQPVPLPLVAFQCHVR